MKRGTMPPTPPAVDARNLDAFKNALVDLAEVSKFALKLASDPNYHTDMQLRDPSCLPAIINQLITVANSLEAAVKVRLPPEEVATAASFAQVENMEQWSRTVARVVGKLLREGKQSRTEFIETSAGEVKDLLSPQLYPFNVNATYVHELFARYNALAAFAPFASETLGGVKASKDYITTKQLAVKSLIPLLQGADEGDYHALVGLLHIASMATYMLSEYALKHQETMQWAARRYPYYPCLLNARNASFKEARAQLKRLGVGVNYINWQPSFTPFFKEFSSSQTTRPRDVANAYAVALYRTLHANRDQVRARIRHSVRLYFLLVDPKEHRRYLELLSRMYDPEEGPVKERMLKACESAFIPLSVKIRNKILLTDRGAEITTALDSLMHHWHGRAAELPLLSKATADKWWDLAEEILLEKYRETDRAKIGRFSFKEKDGTDSVLMRLAGNTTKVPWSRVENRIMTKLKAAFVRLTPTNSRKKLK